MVNWVTECKLMSDIQPGEGLEGELRRMKAAP